MTKGTTEYKKNTSAKVEHTIPKVLEKVPETSPETETEEVRENIQNNGQSRRSVEGPEDYISHDTDDLK